MMEYKGYIGNVEFDDDANIFIASLSFVERRVNC